MGFNSLDYFAFLLFTFIIFWQFFRHHKYKISFLLIASYFFYFSWNGAFLLLIIISTLIDYAAGYFIYKYRNYKKLKTSFLLLSLFSNLFILFFFKYLNFFIDNINWISQAFGKDFYLNNIKLILPIGISFYTFQSLSYTLDIYAGTIKPVKSFKSFALFVSFFPQLIAGPIVRAIEFLPQLEIPSKLTKTDFGQGIFLILRGVIKKLLIADLLAYAIVDVSFNTPDLFTSSELFVSLIAFHFQVYCDFSGYTDIALGSAKLFGFILPENFKSPYQAHSPANFWKRWHMTLSRYIFDYVYKNLGGGINGAFKKYKNILLTFAIIGFWHGASWNFVLFGIYHAIGVIASNIFSNLKKTKINCNRTFIRINQILLTNLFIIFSLPLFRAQNIKKAGFIYKQIFSFNGFSLSFSALSLSILMLAITSHYLPISWNNKFKNLFIEANVFIKAAIILLISFLIYKMETINSNSFIYFQF